MKSEYFWDNWVKEKSSSLSKDEFLKRLWQYAKEGDINLRQFRYAIDQLIDHSIAEERMAILANNAFAPQWQDVGDW